MLGMDQEKVFTMVFGFGVFVFCLVVIGFFLLAMKILLIFFPDLYIMGIHFTRY